MTATGPRQTPHRDQVFDPEAFWWALNYRRVERDLSWREVFRQAQISSPGTGISLTQGRSISVDNFFKLMQWLGETDITPYVRTEPVPNKSWDRLNRKDAV